jgi:hypothetical protein
MPAPAAAAAAVAPRVKPAKPMDPVKAQKQADKLKRSIEIALMKEMTYQGPSMKGPKTYPMMAEKADIKAEVAELFLDSQWSPTAMIVRGHMSFSVGKGLRYGADLVACGPCAVAWERDNGHLSVRGSYKMINYK